MKRIPFPILILLLWTSVSFASQPTGPEFPLDTTHTYNHARFDQRFPAVTFDGSKFLVVWQDLRRETEYDIFGSRVSFDGSILDPGGIPISMSPEFQSYPVIASGLFNSIVVWVDGRGLSSGTDLSLYGTRLTPGGSVLDPNGIFISDALSNPRFPSISFGGSNFLVVWQAYDVNPNNIEIFGVRLDINGIPLDGSPFPITRAIRRQRVPSIAFDGTNYLVVWEDNRNGREFDIFGARVNPMGIVLDTNGISISTMQEDQMNPAIAFDGTNYLVTWHNDSDTSRLGRNFDIHGRRISSDGSLLDTSDIIIGRAIKEQILPVVIFNGTYFFVNWIDRRDNISDIHNYNVYGARVDPDGTVLDTLGIQISFTGGSEFRPALAFNGLNHLSVWSGEEPVSYSQSNIMGARVDEGGSLLDSLSISISNATLHQKSPDLAFDGNNALVTWSEGYNIWDGGVPGIRVNGGGNLIDPIPFPIFQYSDSSKERDNPSVSFDGSNFLVVSGTTSPSESEASHVDSGGAVLDSLSILVGRWNRTISFDGTNYLLLWNTGMRMMEGRRIDTAGNVLDSLPINITPNITWSVAYYPSLAFDGTNYLAIWVGMIGANGPWIYAGRITPNGIPLDSNGIFVSNWGPFDFSWNSVFLNEIDKQIDLAFDGTNYLAIWEDPRNDANLNNTDIYGARIAPNGTVLDTNGIPVCTEGEDQFNPSVIFDGKNFLVVWEDYRNNIVDIYGTEVTSSGLVLNPSGVLISEGSLKERLPNLIKVGDGRSLVVYQSFRPKPYGSDRIYGRLFESSVGVEEENSFSFSQFKLFKNRPNPFRGRTTLTFNLPNTSFVTLKVYDISGRLIKTVLEENKKAGFYTINWEGKDENGKNLSSGIYFCRLIVGAYGDTPLHTQARKMILLK